MRIEQTWPPAEAIQRQLRRVRHRLDRRKHVAPTMWSDVVAQAASFDGAPVGVDIFDTALVRRVVGVPAAERIAAHRVIDAGLWPGSVDEFLGARRQAAGEWPERSLREWLDHPAFAGLTDAGRALAVEFEVEDELLVAVAGASAGLRQLRQGHAIHFLSDMHLSGTDLRALLDRRGLVEPSDLLVSSSDVGRSKADGRLFQSLLEACPAGGSRTGPLHVGNDLWADITRAAEAGAVPLPMLGANPSRFESAVATRPETVGPVVAGAARLVRLQAQHQGDEDSRIRALGAQTIGQLMAAFLLWIRQECEAESIGSIAFLARDGELPLLMAEAMPADYWSGHTLEYLHCGRKAWSLAAAPLVGVAEWIEIGTADDAAFLLHSARTAPFSALLGRVGLDIEDLPPDAELRGADPELPLDGEQSQQWSDLLRTGRLNSAVAEAAQEPMKLIIDHLRQSSLPIERVALVDVGWRGQQAWLISALVKEALGHEPLHLHFGGDGIVRRIDERIDIRRFALDSSVTPHPIASPVACLEMFLASGKPRLVGYERRADGSVVEIFDGTSTSVDNATRRLLAEGAIELAASLPELAEVERWGVESMSLIAECRELLALYWNDPSDDELELFSKLQFESDDSGEVMGPVFAPYHPKELQGRDAVPRVWRTASLRSTAWWFRPVMQTYFAFKDRLR